jgi:hypothetical protein
LAASRRRARRMRLPSGLLWTPRTCRQP